jgi:hypothetical protein
MVPFAFSHVLLDLVKPLVRKKGEKVLRIEKGINPREIQGSNGSSNNTTMGK